MSPGGAEAARTATPCACCSAHREKISSNRQENKSKEAERRGEIAYRSEGVFPMDKWFLPEWEFNDNPASITLWIDGRKVVTTLPTGEKIDNREIRMAESQRDGGA